MTAITATPPPPTTTITSTTTIITATSTTTTTTTIPNQPHQHLPPDRCRRDTVAPVWDGLMPAILAGIQNWKLTLQSSNEPFAASLAASSAAVRDGVVGGMELD